MKISTYLALGLVVVGVIVGVSFGYYLTPEYKVSMYSKNSMSLGQADRTFDLKIHLGPVKGGTVILDDILHT